MLALIILSLIVIGVTTIVYFNNQNEQYHKDRLQRKEKTVLMSLSYFFKGATKQSEINGVSQLFEEEITKLADINNVEINIFNLSGEILTSSNYDYSDPDFYKTKVPDNILFDLVKTEQRHVQKIDNNHVSTYSLLYGKDHQIPLAVVNIPYNTDNNVSQSDAAPFLTTLIEIYVFLLIGASLVAFLLSNYITKNLRKITDKLKGVEINKKNETLAWSGDDEIGALVTEYNRMIGQLEISADKLAKSERESAWREMAKQVAHEIKNPLTPMKLSVQHLQRALKPDDPEYDEKLSRFSDKLITQIDALTNIANEFSNFAKMPKGRKENVDILQIIRATKDLFDEHENITIVLNAESVGNMPFEGDSEQITRVFNNVIKNAIQAIPDEDEGNITIDCMISMNHYVISIKDDGVGIPEEILDKIFVPNFTTKSSGSGLGLAMVKQIVQGHDGQITFKTKANNGTQFTVRFPININ